MLDETPIARGIRYARNQRQALLRFLDDARLPIHDNTSELALRREVVGRKNWLFVGSEDGRDVDAAFVSLLASCQLHKIEPWSYSSASPPTRFAGPCSPSTPSRPTNDPLVTSARSSCAR